MQVKHSASPLPALKQLLLVGGGHSHLFVLAAFARKPVPGIRLVLISEDTMTGYSGMLPGLIAGQYTFDESHIDLRRLCESCGVVFIRDRVKSLDLGQRRVHCAAHGSMRYDWLSINTGSTPDLRGISGTFGNSVSVKPIQGFLKEIARIEQEIATAPEIPRQIGVVGAGAAGVEVVLSLQTRFENRFPEARQQFHLFGAQHSVMPGHPKRVRKHLANVLRERGVQFHTDVRVREVSGSGIVDERGVVHLLDEVVFVTGSMPQRWLAESGLAVDDRGFIRVHDTLQSVSHPEVFAAGDVASIDGYALEKAGVFAVRQGKPLALNLRRAILKRALKRYRPQSKWLAIVNEGGGSAVASRGWFFASGKWVWRWKDRIDRKFMAMFQTFSPMKPITVEVPEALKTSSTVSLLENLAMRCSGCGSKVGAGVLMSSLSSMRQSDCGTIEGLQSPDDAAVFDVPSGKRMVQSLDFFTAPLDDPFVVGQLAAVHSLSDLHAMGAEPHSALAMVTLPLASREIMGDVLDQLLAGALQVFRDEKVCLAGGHTTEGTQLSVGFSVNGLIAKEAVWSKSGIRPGDAVILTKPLGSGVLLAAHKQMRAQGQWLDDALASMTHSNGHAATVLKGFEVHACTDVTGFGLMGHLAEMLRGSKVDLELLLQNLPIFEGVLSLSREGVRSTLYPENVSSRHIIGNLDQVVKHERFPVLFDPQTAGGLLLCVPCRDAQKCLEQLSVAGVSATQLGKAKSGQGEVFWL